MDSREYSLWLAADRRWPLGGSAEMRHGILCALVATLGITPKDGNPWRPWDFTTLAGDEADEVDDPDVKCTRLAEKLKAMTIAAGGTIRGSHKKPSGQARS